MHTAEFLKILPYFLFYKYYPNSGPNHLMIRLPSRSVLPSRNKMYTRYVNLNFLVVTLDTKTNR